MLLSQWGQSFQTVSEYIHWLLEGSDDWKCKLSQIHSITQKHFVKE